MPPVICHPIEPTPAEPSAMADAITHPFRRLRLWAGLALAVGFLLAGVSTLIHGTGVRGSIKITVAAAGVIIFCYMATIADALTNHSNDPAQRPAGEEPAGESFLLEFLCVFAMAFAPAGLWYWSASYGEVDFEPWGTFIAAFGCCYFCMGLIGVEFYGGLQGATPFIVLPALMKIGAGFSLAACAFMLVPWMLRLLLNATTHINVGILVIASTAAAYLLICHARLVTTFYLDNRNRVGWE